MIYRQTELGFRVDRFGGQVGLARLHSSTIVLLLIVNFVTQVRLLLLLLWTTTSSSSPSMSKQCLRRSISAYEENYELNII